jgi:hypothetical protein
VHNLPAETHPIKLLFVYDKTNVFRLIFDDYFLKNMFTILMKSCFLMRFFIFLISICAALIKPQTFSLFRKYECPEVFLPTGQLDEKLSKNPWVRLSLVMFEDSYGLE